MILQKFLRSVNSRLVTVDNVVLEKVLKIFFALSIFLYRNFGKRKPAGDPVVEIDNFDGSIRMSIDRSRSMGAAIFWTGFHEFREFLFLHRFLTRTMVVIDVGANQGEYALFAARRVTQGKVVAFEPLPTILHVLYKNVSLNNFKNIQIFEMGLSDAEGYFEIHEIDDAHEGLATAYPGKRKSKSVHKIVLRTLDDVIREQAIERVDFIKIDIEGGELKALKGSLETLKRFRPAVMAEINAETYAAAGYTVNDVGSFFQELGYDAYTIGKRGILVRCGTLPLFGNIVFKPQ